VTYRQALPPVGKGRGASPVLVRPVQVATLQTDESHPRGVKTLMSLPTSGRTWAETIEQPMTATPGGRMAPCRRRPRRSAS
jgi:hypothetical protein